MHRPGTQLDGWPYEETGNSGGAAGGVSGDIPLCWWMCLHCARADSNCRPGLCIPPPLPSVRHPQGSRFSNLFIRGPNPNKHRVNTRIERRGGECIGIGGLLPSNFEFQLQSGFFVIFCFQLLRSLNRGWRRCPSSLRFFCFTTSLLLRLADRFQIPMSHRDTWVRFH